mmetsp:Transcript_25216/g.37346  ORF Transcript_25216/g.37346 Transcript_25216/m.37346 type:complete len:169 (-) Transcript_25216:717-1223(-)
MCHNLKAMDLANSRITMKMKLKMGANYLWSTDLAFTVLSTMVLCTKFRVPQIVNSVPCRSFIINVSMKVGRSSVDNSFNSFQIAIVELYDVVKYFLELLCIPWYNICPDTSIADRSVEVKIAQFCIDLYAIALYRLQQPLCLRKSTFKNNFSNCINTLQRKTRMQLIL